MFKDISQNSCLLEYTVSAKMKGEIKRRCNEAFSSTSQDQASDGDEERVGDSERLTRQSSSTASLTLMQRFDIYVALAC